MKPRHRTHAGWLDLVLFRPEIPRRAKKMFTALLEHGSYRNKALNQYSCTRARLAELLEIDERNVQRSLVWAVDAGWLVICVRGQKGRQQVYHRSVPWDHPRYWRGKPCPTCQWRPSSSSPREGRLAEAAAEDVQGDDFTPVQGDVSTAYNVSQNVSPICSTRSTRAVLANISGLPRLSDRSSDWPGWQFVAPLVRAA